MLFQGLITAMVTPFKDDGFGINQNGVESLVNYLIEGGISGIFTLGTNGEAYVMKEDEKLKLIEYTMKSVNDRIPVYAGTGMNSTQETIELSKKMEQLGVSALSVITPYFAKLSDNELYNHYKSISESVNVPIILYNIPARTGNDLSKELVSKLAKLDNIKGIKDSSGKKEKLEEYLEAGNGQDFYVMSGSDGMMVEGMKLGCSGAISGTSNVITKLDQKIFDAYKEGGEDLALKYHNQIQLFRKINKYATEPAVIKYSLYQRNINVGQPRLPILPLTEEIKKEVEEMMTLYDEIESSL